LLLLLLLLLLLNCVIEYAIKTVQEDLLEFEWNGLQDTFFFFKIILCYSYCAFSYIQYIN